MPIKECDRCGSYCLTTVAPCPKCDGIAFSYLSDEESRIIPEEKVLTFRKDAKFKLGESANDLNLAKLVPTLGQKNISFEGQFLGGYGLRVDIKPGTNVRVNFGSGGIEVNSEFFGWEDLIDLSIGGPGMYTTGGGWFGGGFGVKGALEGAAFASIMNILTTKVNISTILRLIFVNAELNIHTSVFTPENLDIELSPLRAFIKLKNSEQTKICPDCAEEVKAAAKKCRFCSYIFQS